MRKILVLGAASSIAMHAMRCFAADGDIFFLVGRSAERLQSVKDDLIARGALRVEWAAADLADVTQHSDLVHRAHDVLEGLDLVLIAWGVLGNQSAGEKDFRIAQHDIHANFVSVASALTVCANLFEKQGSGTIVAISSVAGDRGRQSNYIYGCAKGALSIFLQGLRNRLYHKGVKVLTVKPGFVDTPMTAGIKKNFLYASPEQVGEGIYNAVERGRSVVYLPWFWAFIMLIIRNIPEFVFKRLKL